MEFENLLFNIVDQVTEMEVDDVMLRQTLPLVEGDAVARSCWWR